MASTDERDGRGPGLNRGPLVSVVIPTRNAAKTIGSAIQSLANQSYENIEVIVVDRNSADGTTELLASYPWVRLLKAGPERSSQFNLGAHNANGKYLYFIGADFLIEKDVITQAVQRCEAGFDAVIIHNTSDPSISFWSRVRKLERDCYAGDDLHVGARFIRYDIFRRIGGYDERLVAGEDYDLHQRLLAVGARIGWIDAKEYHIGEPRTLREVVGKHLYYGRHILRFIMINFGFRIRQLSPFRASYVRNIRRFFDDPRLLIGFLLYQFIRYTSAGMGLVAGLLSSPLRIKSIFPPLVYTLEDQVELLKRVSVIVTTRNRPSDLEACLNSLQECVRLGSELIVVDDCSDDTSVIQSSIQRHGARLFRNQNRLFLNPSRNRGASFATRDYLLFVDDDNRVTKDAVTALANALHVYGKMAVAAPIILAEDGRVWYAGGWISPLSCLTVFRFRGFSLEKVPKTMSETMLFHSCFMIRSDLFRMLGGFDAKRFPMYLGEADLSERLRRRGYRIMVNPSAVATHSIRPSRGLMGTLRNIHITEPVRAYFVARNRLLYMRRHRSALQFLLYVVFFQPVIALIHILMILAARRVGKYKWTQIAGPYVRGMLDGILGDRRYGKPLL